MNKNEISMGHLFHFPVLSYMNKVQYIHSEFNITWYPQEKHWKNKPKIKSLWSGTVIDFEKNGKLFNKRADKLDNKKLKEEIIYQILRSKSFQKLIYDNNGFNINKEDIEYIEIWYE